MRISLSIAATILLMALGCAQHEPLPIMPLRDVHAEPIAGEDLRPPQQTLLTRRDVSEEARRLLPPVTYQYAQWRPTSRSALPIAETVDMEVVTARPGRLPSPYRAGDHEVFDRVLFITRDGRLFYTPQPGARDSLDPAKSVSLDYLTLSSPHGRLGSDGKLHTVPLAPMEVAQSGYVCLIGLEGTNLSRRVVLAPVFDGLSGIGARGDDGRDGPAGYSGDSGRDGDDGQEGRWPGVRSWLVQGGKGENGRDGRDGQRGQDGYPGWDGQDAPTFRVIVEELPSRFYDRPLMKLSFQAGGKELPDRVVLDWGRQLRIDARGGDGGMGGKGSHGEAGRDGQPGRRGTDGSDATQHSGATSGGAGSSGWDGGDGKDGGDGGDGGNGGDGGDAGRGGDGGSGGDGGRGGDVTVTIRGSQAFAAMVRTALVIDVRGGDGGGPGAPGVSGSAGQAGHAGRGGPAGPGGRAGRGGAGGPGGSGGRGIRWTQRIPDPSRPEGYREETHSRPGGMDGPSGKAGRDGDPGRPGRRGSPGKAGKEGSESSDGRWGSRGSSGWKGSVRYVEEITPKRELRCDVRMVRVADGVVAAAADAAGDQDETGKIARSLADQLLKLGPGEKVNIAVIRLANRGQSEAGDKAASEISDKLAAALHESKRWKLVERIDLQAILEEKDLIRAESEPQAILADPRLKKRLAGADYLILGGVSSGG